MKGCDVLVSSRTSTNKIWATAMAAAVLVSLVGCSSAVTSNEPALESSKEASGVVKMVWVCDLEAGKTVSVKVDRVGLIAPNGEKMYSRNLDDCSSTTKSTIAVETTAYEFFGLRAGSDVAIVRAVVPMKLCAWAVPEDDKVLLKGVDSQAAYDLARLLYAKFMPGAGMGKVSGVLEADLRGAGCSDADLGVIMSAAK